jgi:hypothetical protein
MAEAQGTRESEIAAGMAASDGAPADPAAVGLDLACLGAMLAFRARLTDGIAAACRSPDEKVLAKLRLDAMQSFVEFFFQLKAREIVSVEDFARLVDGFNDYFVSLSRDTAKMARLGLGSDRLVAAVFTDDVRPRLLQTWRDRPGSIDQSNLGRFLAVAMSTETTRQLVIAACEAGFLERDRTPYGTVIVRSTGVMERVYGAALRQFRLDLAEAGLFGPAAGVPAGPA